MKKKKRDYRAEYRRRIANAAKRGLSRSQARGHAKPGEVPVKPRKSAVKSDPKLEAALKALHSTRKIGDAAKQAGVAPERLRRFVKERGLAERKGNRWRITDNRPREMLVLTNGDTKLLHLSGFDQASRNGEHLSAVRNFLRTNDIEFLRPFDGQFVTDASARNTRSKQPPTLSTDSQPPGTKFSMTFTGLFFEGEITWKI